MRVISFKIEEYELELVDEYARKKKITRSELIRRAINKYIQEQEERPYITRRIRVY